jgi:hypothetical protein
MELASANGNHEEVKTFPQTGFTFPIDEPDRASTAIFIPTVVITLTPSSLAYRPLPQQLLRRNYERRRRRTT